MSLGTNEKRTGERDIVVESEQLRDQCLDLISEHRKLVPFMSRKLVNSAASNLYL